MNILSIESLLAELDKYKRAYESADAQILSLKEQRNRLTDERDYLVSDSAAAWDKCEERRLENQKLTAELDAAMTALREAKEDILAFGNHEWDCKFALSNFVKPCTCWHGKAIANINKVLGEE